MALEELDMLYENLTNNCQSLKGSECLYIQLLHYINKLCLRLINDTSEELPGTISESIEEVEQLLKAERFNFYVREKDGRFKGIFSNNKEEDLTDTFIGSSLRKGLSSQQQGVIFTSPRNFPPELADLKDYFSARDLKRLFFIPVIKENSLQGFCWLELKSNTCHGDEVLCDFILRLGRVFLNAYDRYWKKLEQQTLHKQVVNNLADIVCIINKKGELQYVIPSCQKTLGYGAEELTGSSFYELVHEDNQVEVIDAVEDSLNSRTPARFDFRIKHYGGYYHWVEAICNSLYDARGELTGAIINIRNISERKRLEHTLIEKSQELEMILDSIEVHVFCLKDPETNGYVNRAAAEFIGKTKEEMRDKKLKDVFSREQADLLIEKNRLVFEKKKRLNYEVEVLNKDNENRTLLTTVTPRLDEDNDVDYAIFAALDITELKTVKEKLIRSYLKSNKLARKLETTNRRLKENQKLFRINFEESNIGMGIEDANLNFIRVNRAFAGMLGYSKTELKSISAIDVTHPEDLDKTSYYSNRLLSGEIKNANFEKRYLSKDGEVVWGSVHFSLARDEEGRPLFFLNQIEDITGKKRIETVFKQQKEELEYSRLKTQFFANLSHELRTPLNLIFSTLKLLSIYKDKQLGLHDDKRLCRYIRVLRQNGYRLLRMVNNLIDLTRIDSDYYQLNMENHDIVRLVSDIISSSRDYILSKERNLSLYTHCDKKIISCDPFSIERILLNLISNALKFTAAGDDIVVSLQDRGDTILITVKDSGIGIEREKLDIIFEHFRQVEDNIFRRNNEGSGMGLAIVKKLVELHEGRVWVDSEYGQGSEFFIELPVKKIAENQNRPGEAPANVPQELIDRVVMEFSDI